jgi:hypothetical protein
VPKDHDADHDGEQQKKTGAFLVNKQS